ncbi:MAG: hypothetical protein JST82_04650 [Bacteroidetes bacterium]|nr:hypothetical protein [Bacteroidota bacterium]
MKRSYLLLLLLGSCVNHPHKDTTVITPKDTIIQVWKIQQGDTVSGYGIYIHNGDTVIGDYGVNADWHPKK